MQKKKIKVAVIMGGKTAEHEVSIASGEAILKNINKNKYLALPVKITKTGIWKTNTTNSTIKTLEKVMRNDVAFIAIHGPYGEDGTIQGLLEMLGIPYTGAGILASALAIDKLKTKEIMKANNINIAKYYSFSKNGWGENRKFIIEKIIKNIGFPCVIKPNNLGSSVGINIPKDEKQLEKSCLEALKYSDLILAEEYIRGREIHCGVLGNDSPKALTLDEVLPENEFYDYEAKYKEGKSNHQMPAQLPEILTEKIKKLAIKIYKIILCQGMARVDFFLKRKKIYFNEVNTIPGFTETSIFPKEAMASGISYEKLIDEIIKLALNK